jgi:hypothetical protein
MDMRKAMCAMLATMATIALLQNSYAEGEPRVLLAWEKTRFKGELIKAMESELKAAGFAVTTVMHDKKGMPDVKAADFDAVFITNSGVHSKVRGWVSAWIAKNQEQQDRILLHTTQTSNWEVKADVDAITSASSRKDVKTLAADYVSRLKAMVEKPDEES